MNNSAVFNQAIQLKPVGAVHNQSRETDWGKDFSDLSWQKKTVKMKEMRDRVSKIEIDPGLEGILDGIEDFSHLLVLYWAHLVPAERRSQTKVHPLGNPDFPLVGIFATQSPVRPNSILATFVRLIQRNKNTLLVTGLDALDGSPVLDIKPFNPEEKHENVKLPVWMRQVHREFQKDAGQDCDKGNRAKGNDQQA